jgi:hypothetical protein
VERDIKLEDMNASVELSIQQGKVERLACGRSGPPRTVKLNKKKKKKKKLRVFNSKKYVKIKIKIYN